MHSKVYSECIRAKARFFFYKLIYGNFFSDLGGGGVGGEKISQLTGHFQSFFFFFFLNLQKKH